MTRRRPIDLFSPVFVIWGLLLSYAGLGIADYFKGTYSRDTVVLGLAYLALFACCFAIGVKSRIGISLVSRLPRLNCELPRRRLGVIALVSLPLGVVLFSVIVRMVGLASPLEILTNLLAFREGSGKAGTEYLLFAAMFFIEAPFWALLLSGRIKPAGGLALAAYWLLILLFSILTGARVRVYSAVLGLAYVFHHLVRPIRLGHAVVLGAIALLPFALFYRLQGSVRAESTSVEAIAEAAQGVEAGKAVGALALRVTDAYDGFLTILDNRDRVEFLWGQSFRDAVFLPVPRVWMPQKPSAFNYEMLHQLAPERESVFFGAEYSVLGELYMNFQVGGIVIGALAFGMLVGVLNRYYLDNTGNRAFLFLYRPLCLALPMAWMSSGIINTEAHAILALNALFGTVFLAIARRRRGPMWVVRNHASSPQGASGVSAALSVP